MVWRLTLLGMLLFAHADIAAGQPSTPPSLHSGGDSRSARVRDHSVHWERVPLGDAVERLKAVSGVSVFLDRRVDPNQRINLSMQHAAAEEIVAQLAAACSLGHCRLERLFYVGPPRTADRLRALAALRRKDVAALAADGRRTTSTRRRIVWRTSGCTSSLRTAISRGPAPGSTISSIGPLRRRRGSPAIDATATSDVRSEGLGGGGKEPAHQDGATRQFTG